MRLTCFSFAQGIDRTLLNYKRQQHTAYAVSACLRGALSDRSAVRIVEQIVHGHAQNLSRLMQSSEIVQPLPKLLQKLVTNSFARTLGSPRTIL